jgi:DNA-directed RNA polymerase subunit RPC12/RpoP
VCANCGRLVGLDWSLCAWCGRDFERPDGVAYEPIATTMPERLQAPASPAASTARRQEARASSSRRSTSGQTSEP